MTIIYALNWVILAAAIAVSLYSFSRAPGPLSRTVSLDLLTACTIGVVALSTVTLARNDTMQIVVVMTLVSFLTATSVARIVSQQQVAKQAAIPSLPRDNAADTVQVAEEQETTP